jgi:hypothetical protein
MSIKPVDLQVLIPRTMEASKVSNDEAQKNLATQQQQASSMQHKVDSSLNQVYSRNKPQNARINEKQKDNSKGKDQKRKKDKADDEDEKSLNKGIQTSTIDIKI